MKLIADKKVISIVQHYLHRIGNNRVSENISAITLDDSCLSVYVARTPRGEEMNNNWRCRQRNAYNQKNLDTKRPKITMKGVDTIECITYTIFSSEPYCEWEL